VLAGHQVDDDGFVVDARVETELDDRTRDGGDGMEIELPGWPAFRRRIVAVTTPGV
jgi:hypothetical protein